MAYVLDPLVREHGLVCGFASYGFRLLIIWCRDIGGGDAKPS